MRLSCLGSKPREVIDLVASPDAEGAGIGKRASAMLEKSETL
jgi:hypothetical protein